MLSDIGGSTLRHGRQTAASAFRQAKANGANGQKTAPGNGYRQVSVGDEAATRELTMTRARLDPSILSHLVPSRDHVLAGMMVIAILAGNAARSSAHAQGAAQPGQASSGVPKAPLGHRQPNAQNVPPNVLRSEDALTADDTALDKKLNICRGC
jgi:hypothetical protein